MREPAIQGIMVHLSCGHGQACTTQALGFQPSRKQRDFVAELSATAFGKRGQEKASQRSKKAL
jgi:hypothetical protein